MNYRILSSSILAAAILSIGCGSDGTSNITSGGTSSASNSSPQLVASGTSSSSRLLADLRALAALLAEKAGQTNVQARATLDRQISIQIPGPGGGSASLSGDFNVGADSAHPATSSISVVLNQFTFLDGLTLSGGTIQATTVLYGTETAANGKLTLDAQNVVFSGTATGTHSFKIEIQLVNSKPINTVLTFDGQRRELGFFLKIANYSATPDDKVFVSLVAKNDTLAHFNYLSQPDAASMTEFEDSPGQFLPKTAQGAFIGSEKYSFPLSDMTPVGEKTRGMFIPRNDVVSGRVYLSFGRKLQGIGINSPYYNSSGRPVSNGASASGTLQANSTSVTLSGIDATQSLANGEPVSYSLGGTNYTATIVEVSSPTQIRLDRAPSSAGTATLNFQPDPAVIAAAKKSLSQPSATGAPDYLVTYDFVELSSTTNANAPDPFYTLFANTTAIDFFSVGLGMTVEFAGLPPLDGKPALAPSEQTVGFGTSAANIKSGISTRSQIIARFNNSDQNPVSTPAEFQNFVSSVPQGSSNLVIGQAAQLPDNVIRVLGPPPVVALQPAGGLANYLQSALASQWPVFCSNAFNLTGVNAIFYPLTNPSFTYVGTSPSSSSTLNLKCSQANVDDHSLGEVYQLPIPTTRVVFECDDKNPGPSPNNYENSGTEAHKRLASLVLSAFNRGAFASVANWSDRSKFYADPSKKYNFFARVMHEFALDGVVYGFAYDDVFGQDSTIAGPIDLTGSSKVPSSLKGNVVDVQLTIPNFTAPPPPALPGAPLRFEAVLVQGKLTPASPEGCILHFTAADGSKDIVNTLDSNGAANVTGLLGNTDYYTWIAPGGPNPGNWDTSYSALGHYDGTLTGSWNSSFGTNTTGVVRVQFGRSVPGSGSALDPQPAPLPAPLPGKAPFPPLTPNSGQATWGN